MTITVIIYILVRVFYEKLQEASAKAYVERNGR